MDWSKAKTILIIAFIVTNIVLGYALFNSQRIDEPTLKEDFITDVAKLLKEKDITLNTAIPKEIPSLGIMTVVYEQRTPGDLNKSFFNNTAEGVTVNEGVVLFEKGKEKLIVTDGKNILYLNDDEEEKYPSLDKEEAIYISKKFLEEKGFSKDDMKLTFQKESNGVFFLEYSKVYNGIYIEKSYTNFQIDKRGVKRFERLWLNEEKLSENKIYISTAPKAILTLLTMENIYGKTIDDISLCYYFDPVKHKEVDEPEKTKQGKAVPAWRIQFSDGNEVILDEY